MQKRFAEVTSIVLVKQTVYIIGKHYTSDYNAIDAKTEMYKVTPTDSLVLIVASDVRKERFYNVDGETILVNFYFR